MTKEALQIALDALTDFDYDKRINAIEIIKKEERDNFIAFAKLVEEKKRTWVGLTDEEIQECLQGLPTQTIDVYARRIEAKLKEKNT